MHTRIGGMDIIAVRESAPPVVILVTDLVDIGAQRAVRRDFDLTCK